MNNDKTFYNLFGNEATLRTLETMVKDLKACHLTGCITIPNYAVNNGVLIMDNFTVLVSVKDENIYDLYEFVDTHDYSIGIEACKYSEMHNSSIQVYEKGALPYGF